MTAERLDWLDEMTGRAAELCATGCGRFATTLVPGGAFVCDVCEQRVARSILKDARARRVAKRAPKPMSIPRTRNAR